MSVDFALSVESMEELMMAFESIDTNRDGVIDPNELDAMIVDSFPGISAETAVNTREAIIRDGDINGDGKIDFGEFLGFLARRRYIQMGLGSREQSTLAENEDPSAPTDDVTAANSSLNIPNKANEDTVSMQDVRGSEANEDELMTPTEGPNDCDGDDDVADPRVAAIMKNLTTDEIDMLRDAFIHMDRDSDGFVGFDEMMDNVLAVVGAERFDPLREYLQPIFVVADKDLDNRLSLTEFLSSFADGPGVVPSDVVNACVSSIRVRLTDEEIWTLQESFRRIDKNADGYIDADELKVALKEVLHGKFPDLTDHTFNEIVTVVLASADADHDGKLSLSEFIRSFQEDQGVLPAAFIDVRAQHVARQLTQEEVAVLKDAFQTLDSNNDGFVDYSEMHQALWEALSSSIEDKDQVRELCDLIMVTADRNKDGRLTLTDFIRNFVQNLDLMKIPVAAAQDRVRKATDRLQEIVDSGDLEKMVRAFQDLDTNQDGFLEPSELHGILSSLLGERFPEWDEDQLTGVVDAIISAADTDQDGKLSLQEFVSSFVDGYGVLPPEVIQHWGEDIRRELSDEELSAVIETFRRMDLNNDGLVSREELQAALGDALGGMIESEEHLQRVTDFVLSKVDVNDDGVVSLHEFVRSFELNQGVLPVAQEDQDQAQEEEDDEQAATTEVEQEAPETSETPIDIRPKSPVATTLEVASPATMNQPVEPLAAVAVAAQQPPEEHTPERQHVQVAADAPSPITNDVSGVCISDNQLKVEFSKYDKDGTGLLDREEFKAIYSQMENYGLEPTPHEIDRLFSRYAGTDAKINYNEFCLLMLQRSRM